MSSKFVRNGICLSIFLLFFSTNTFCLLPIPFCLHWASHPKTLHPFFLFVYILQTIRIDLLKVKVYASVATCVTVRLYACIIRRYCMSPVMRNFLSHSLIHGIAKGNKAHCNEIILRVLAINIKLPCLVFDTCIPLNSDSKPILVFFVSFPQKFKKFY